MNKILTDHNALDQYEEVFGDESAEFIIDIIDSFLRDAPNQFSLLEKSVAENDSSTFQRVAHTLKTGCKTVGAPSLGELFQALEDMGERGDLSSITAIYEQCKIGFEDLKPELAAKKEAIT